MKILSNVLRQTGSMLSHLSWKMERARERQKAEKLKRESDEVEKRRAAEGPQNHLYPRSPIVIHDFYDAIDVSVSGRCIVFKGAAGHEATINMTPDVVAKCRALFAPSPFTTPTVDEIAPADDAALDADLMAGEAKGTVPPTKVRKRAPRKPRR